MDKKELTERIKLALLGVIAISGVITAWELQRIARNGFEVEITTEQADSLLRNANEAKTAAFKAMSE